MALNTMPAETLPIAIVDSMVVGPAAPFKGV